MPFSSSRFGCTAWLTRSPADRNMIKALPQLTVVREKITDSKSVH